MDDIRVKEVVMRGLKFLTLMMVCCLLASSYASAEEECCCYPVPLAMHYINIYGTDLGSGKTTGRAGGVQGITAGKRIGEPGTEDPALRDRRLTSSFPYHAQSHG